MSGTALASFVKLRDAVNGRALPAAHKQHVGLSEEFPSFKPRQFFQIIDAEKQIEPAREKFARMRGGQTGQDRNLVGAGGKIYERVER